ncbi:hypothetical protein KO02_12285 [Sphingobacterium sp. ML3W]|uniref:co-chaperone GroES family protein n=1 Tax=Sphingobacterium sp. ML3W TaxID=1538644 RepID=UPI0004F77545|nr:co-chaperone GroES family protein [Sphingobacterium sp. ML3W]AIM37383.1 hypothetical protein KO02_12285 [Sphingobacterium sp. ML3W]
MKLIGSRILVTPVQSETKRESGIYVPQTVKKQINRGEISLVGNTVKPSGVFPNGLDIGQKVIFKDGAGIDYEHEGVPCKIMFDYDIIAII